MIEEDNRDDTAAVLVDEDGPPISNGRIMDELDKNHQPTGYKLFVPTEDEEKRMARRIAEELDIAEKEYERIWAQMSMNIAAYEALPTDDRDDMARAALTLPVGKRDVNHLVAFFVNRIYNKRPICSIVPEEFGMYEVPMPTGQIDPHTGNAVSTTELRSAEDLADGGERLMEYYLRSDKLKFHRFLYDVIMSSVQGAPPWGKTAYERVLRPQMVPKWRRLPSGMVIADGYTEVERVVGSPHKLYMQSGFNVMMASPWLDPQEAEWVAEHDTAMTIAIARNKVHSNEWYLCDDDKWKTIRKAVGDLDRYEAQNEANAGRKVDRGRKFLDIWNVHLYWPVIFADDQGEDLEGIFSMTVPFERTTETILACPLNPYAHGRRNLVPYYQRPRVNEIGGHSTMEDVLPLQKVKTRLFHSQIQNAMLSNTVFAKVRPGSTAWNWLKSNEIRARSKVPVTNPSDFESEVLGRELRSLAPEIAGIDAMAKELTVSDTVKGATLLGRTSRAAISLVQEAGLTVPNMDLDFICGSLSENLTMLYHNIGQWSVYGEEIPFQDPETRAIVMKAVRFPLEGPNAFSARISASSDEETTQFEFERDMGLSKLQTEMYQVAAQLIAPMTNPNAPPVVKAFQKPMLVANQMLMARIFSLAKMDPKKYALTERQIDEILAAHEQWVEQKMAADAEAAKNAPPKQPEQPHVSISLSGKLTPEQETAVAIMNGIGGDHAVTAIQGANGGGDVLHPLNPNAARPPAMGGAPGNAEVPS